MSSAYRTLNLRVDPSKDLINNSIRVTARQKNKAQMWDRLTFNYLKKLSQQLPSHMNVPAVKQRL